MAEQPYIGDPVKAGKAIIRILDPPLRIQLSTECLLVVRNKACKTIQDGENEDLAHSTNADGIDKNMVLQWFKEINN